MNTNCHYCGKSYLAEEVKICWYYFCVVHIRGTHNGRTFFDRDVSFEFGEGESGKGGVVT